MLLKYFNILFTIHNKKNGHSKRNLSEINGCMAFIKLDKLMFLLSTFKRIEFFVKNVPKTIIN